MRLVIRVIVVALLLPAVATAQTMSSGQLAVSQDGNLLACSNRESGTVSIVAWPSMEKISEIPVGKHPEGLCFLGKTHQIACAVYGDDQISVVDADSGRVLSRVDVFDEPYAVVSTRDGSRIYATLEYPGKIVAVDVPSSTIQEEWHAGQMLRGLGLDEQREAIYVSEYLTGTVKAFHTSTKKLLAEYRGASTDNLARQISVHPTDGRLFVPHVRSRIRVAHGNGSIFPYVSVIRTDGPDSGRRIRVPMDSFRGARVTANPWDTAVSPDGRLLAVVFSGTNDGFLAGIREDSAEIEYASSLRLGANPRAIIFHPDGKRLIVHNALDMELASYDVNTGAKTGSCRLTEWPGTQQELVGKKLFYTALSPMSSRLWISCSSCHPDGDADGRTWQQPEGLRQTQSLAGLLQTHPLHWSADRDEVHDFEHTIRGPLMQGRGLVEGTIPDALEAPLAGRSSLLDALAAYTNSHDFPESPWGRDGLSEQAEQGRRLFFSDSTGCATCHTDPLYTDSGTRRDNGFVMHDVGTGRSDESELMGTAYDTPTLIGVYRTAPYLHDGSAPTLRDVLTTANPNDRHGRTSHLSDQELDALVAFLKCLPYETAEPDSASAAISDSRRTGTPVSR